MALRFLLVGLVASMGLELPKGEDLQSRVRSGLGWINARLADLSDFRAEADRAFRAAGDSGRIDDPAPGPETVQAGPSTADLAFEVVVEGMAAAFSADLAALQAEESAAIAEEIASAEGRGEPAFASWGDPEPEVSPIAAVPGSLPEPSPAATAGDPAGGVSRLDRLASALRLTRQAARAWASLIGEPRVDAVAALR